MSRKRQNSRFVLSLLASTAIPLVAHAAQPSGSAEHVAPAANALGSAGARILEAPGDIFQGDLITTDRGGEVQIRFRDDSRFVVGPNSKVTIDEFVFKPDGTAQDVALAAVKGTFRFIGGRSHSSAYSIRTPTMSIGLRGTIGDIAVRPGGETMVLWEEGSGRLCVVPVGSPRHRATECKDVGAGDFAVAPPGGGFAAVRPGELATRIKAYFPWAAYQGDLAVDYQIAPTGRPIPSPPPDYNRVQTPYR